MFVGREGVRARFVEAVDRALGGEGALVVLSGDRGVGKTALLRRVLAARGEVRVGWGVGGVTTGPFEPWVRALRALGADDGVRALTTGPTARPSSASGSARGPAFDVVATSLVEAAARGPVVVVIDDAQRAGVADLALLAHTTLACHDPPVALVAAAADDDPDAGVGTRAAIDDLRRLGDHVALGPLDEQATRALVAELAPTAGPGLVAAIHARTGGNPLFVREAVEVLRRRRALADANAEVELPTTLRAIVAHRVAALQPASRRFVEVAAVVGEQAAVDVLRDVAARTLVEVDPDIALAGAREHGVLVERAGGAVRFTTPAVREAVLAELPRARRQELHAEVGRSLARAAGLADASRGLVDAARADDPGVAAAAARHLLASGESDARHDAVVLLQHAARTASGGLAHEDAQALLRQAVDHVDPADHALRASLLLDLVDEQLALGDLDAAGATARAAVAAARAARDAVLLARAGIAMGSGEGGFEVPLFDDEQLQALREAVASLPASRTALAARVRARLSVAAAFTAPEDERLRLSEEALALAREGGDDRAVAAALAARCDAEAGPEHSEVREERSSEVVRLARAQHDPRLVLLGYRLRLVARLEQGDTAGAEADADAFRRVAERLGEPLYDWYPRLWRSAIALAEGRLAAAVALREEVAVVGRRLHSTNADLLTRTHRFWTVVETLDLDALQRMRGDMDASLPPVTWARVARALAYATLGRAAQAGVLVEGLLDELVAAPRESEWLPMVAQVAETVAVVGAGPVADWAYEALLPHRHRHVVEGIGAVLRGSVERPLATLAAVRGDRRAAQDHAAAALEANRRLAGAALVARTLRDVGVALDSPVRLDEAATLYDELGWDRRATEARARAAALRDPLASPTGSVHPGAPARPPTVGTPTSQTARLASSRSASRAASDPTGDAADGGAAAAVFRRDGAGWRLAWRGEEVRLRDAKGLHDLHALLSRPGAETPALDLLTATDATGRGGGSVESAVAGAGPEGDLGEVLDATAREAYRRRLVDLASDIGAAEHDHDLGRLEALRDERDALVAQLAAAHGLRGRVRRSGDRSERARTTVTSRIRYSIDRIGEVHPALGQHLANCVRTGRFCSYTPEADVAWDL